jgi:hypothetical protein
MRLSLSTLSRTMLNDDRRILEDLIRANDKGGNDQYIKLSALLGSSGFFTKLGFTGLPLATMALTLILVRRR